MDNELNSQKNKFESIVREHELDLSPLGIDTLQVNITKVCNQSCVHCHVDASPRRTEQMSLEYVEKCLDILSKYKSIRNLDLTGGAPELNPHFNYFVKEAGKLGKHISVRHNLTVTLDGNPVNGENKRYLPRFFADNKVEVISSLPFYSGYLTDKQRGDGVFHKSIESIKLLNSVGYGKDNTGLFLHFIYNPVGSYLPPSQEDLEKDYKRELESKYGIYFNNLYTITNMPVNRFRNQLLKAGSYERYMQKLVERFNPAAAEGIMCRNMISVGYDGVLYDCDFNQMLGLCISSGKTAMSIFDFDPEILLRRKIMFKDHCLGCTAGSGSSCAGTTAD